jgi:hypothetical protein
MSYRRDFLRVSSMGLTATIFGCTVPGLEDDPRSDGDKEAGIV